MSPKTNRKVPAVFPQIITSIRFYKVSQWHLIIFPNFLLKFHSKIRIFIGVCLFCRQFFSSTVFHLLLFIYVQFNYLFVQVLFVSQIIFFIEDVSYWAWYNSFNLKNQKITQPGKALSKCAHFQTFSWKCVHFNKKTGIMQLIYTKIFHENFMQIRWKCVHFLAFSLKMDAFSWNKFSEIGLSPSKVFLSKNNQYSS